MLQIRVILVSIYTLMSSLLLHCLFMFRSNLLFLIVAQCVKISAESPVTSSVHLYKDRSNSPVPFKMVSILD